MTRKRILLGEIVLLAEAGHDGTMMAVIKIQWQPKCLVGVGKRGEARVACGWQCQLPRSRVFEHTPTCGLMNSGCLDYKHR